jgi:hypothetical protein
MTCLEMSKTRKRQKIHKNCKKGKNSNSNKNIASTDAIIIINNRTESIKKGWSNYLITIIL